jgi:hypothetical protein
MHSAGGRARSQRGGGWRWLVNTGPGLAVAACRFSLGGLATPLHGVSTPGRPQHGCSAAFPIGVHTTDALSYNGISR